MPVRKVLYLSTGHIPKDVLAAASVAAGLIDFGCRSTPTERGWVLFVPNRIDAWDDDMPYWMGPIAVMAFREGVMMINFDADTGLDEVLLRMQQLRWWTT